MEDKKIFNNYQSSCPICGAELDEYDKFCPYCGADLELHNQEQRKNETVITDAIDDIDQAKRKLAHREKQFVDNKKRNSSPAKTLVTWMLIAGVGFFCLMFIIAMFVAFNETRMNNKVEEFKTQLYNQQVDTITIDEIDITDLEFTNSKKQSAAGYIQGKDDLLLIPFYSSSYSSDAVFKGSIAVRKDGFKEYSYCDTNRIGLEYEGYNLYIDFSNYPYYDRTIDTITILSDYVDEFKRSSDYKIGKDIFECYIERPGKEFHFVSSPYDACYIGINIYVFGDVELDESVFPLMYVEHQLEIN